MPSSRRQKSPAASETMAPPSIPSTEAPTFASEAEINAFGKYLHSSKRILVLCGAGLSAASGIPTFSGDGAHWRGHKCTSISSIDCFEELPGLVWKYHAERRKLALAAKPNRAHEALAVLAKKKKGVRVLTQNIDGEFCSSFGSRGVVNLEKRAESREEDSYEIESLNGMLGNFQIEHRNPPKPSPVFNVIMPTHRAITDISEGLSQKAKHPKDRLYELHRSLLDIKCSNKECDYYDKDNFEEPVCPALAVDDAIAHFASTAEQSSKEVVTTNEVASKISSLTVEGGKENEGKTDPKPAPKFEPRPNPLADIIASLSPIMTDEMRAEPVPDIKDLPHCPKCSSLLRPAVVWFGESLSVPQYNEITAWIDEERKLDLMIVIGTKGEVFPAGRFVDIAKGKGARICVVNMDKNHLGMLTVREKKDWVFEGNAAEILPVLFEGILLN
ncbi:NAD-dependent protein deacylase [Lachnellula suecica]|uniref:NAD-dependent protein deacylase n=1 Tax=Lachnellula suecica TaxID=602035 RepID=A0A8T9C1F6_9HELO|nr:NAD-dependent protein deacylase [Lachnellula suecica]